MFRVTNNHSKLYWFETHHSSSRTKV